MASSNNALKARFTSNILGVDVCPASLFYSEGGPGNSHCVESTKLDGGSIKSDQQQCCCSFEQVQRHHEPLSLVSPLLAASWRIGAHPAGGSSCQLLHRTAHSRADRAVQRTELALTSPLGSCRHGLRGWSMMRAVVTPAAVGALIMQSNMRLHALIQDIAL